MSYQNNISETIKQLKFYNFKIAVDKSGFFSTDDNLYYKSIGEKKFLILSHFGKKFKNFEMEGFDFWIASFNSEKSIGIEKPIKQNDIILGFDLKRDLIILKKYLL